MSSSDIFDTSYEARLRRRLKQWRWQALHLDPTLLIMLLILCGYGLFVLYSASNDNFIAVEKQTLRLLLGYGVLFLFAQISPRTYYQWTPIFFFVSLLALVAVLFVGQVQQGGRRWFDLHFFYFQPAELMKLAMPMMLAWYLSHDDLPPKISSLLVSSCIIMIPALLIFKEPDLGTALMVVCAGLTVLILAGITWKLVVTVIALATVSMPLLWHHMHDYQRERVLTFFNPESDPLDHGYHIIQSKIAIGSGGLFGKGWLNGSQSHLSFLPEHTTDFIFAVNGEELGLIGCLAVITIFLAIFSRCIYMSTQAQTCYARLLTGSLGVTFIAFAFVNIGMVIGLLPVVGVPLPLISYGGSSMLTFMAGFGMIMSAYTHRNMWSH